MAAGLDPARCILFRQADVREHTELCWLLCAVTAHGDLNRMHQFKEKSAQQRELVSAGLFLYPVLQAADVLAYRADEVPVGDDQRQHLELMRDIAAALQRHLRRDARGARAPHPRGRRADHGPPGARRGRCRPPAAPSRASSTSTTSPTTIRQASSRAP